MVSELKRFWQHAGISIYCHKDNHLKYLLLEDRTGNEFGRIAATTEAETYEQLFEFLLFYTTEMCMGVNTDPAGRTNRAFLA